MMLDVAILNDNLDLIPLTNCFHILGAGGDQIIQGACGTVSINAHFGIGVSVIVQYLHLWCRFVNHIEPGLLRAPVKNTGVSSFGDSPFELQVEISELLGKEQIPTVSVCSFTVHKQAAILNFPGARRIVPFITFPSGSGLAIKQQAPAIGSLRLSQLINVIRQRQRCSAVHEHHCG